VAAQRAHHASGDRGMEAALITVFGGGGFVGRQVTQALLASGLRVRIAQRDPLKAAGSRALGNLGQVQLVRADIADEASVRRALDGAQGAVNLVGLLKGDFKRAHVDGAAMVARVATATGLKALVHVSAIGADAASASAYGRTKGEGEAAVRAAFPSATILRPSIIFGRDDQFTNRFAELIAMAPIVPLIRGEARFQPVYVGDVADAIAAAIMQPKGFAGKTYDLGGPDVLSMGEINRWLASHTGRDKMFLPVPDAVAGLMARLTGWLPGAPITYDQFVMLQSDNVALTEHPGLADFGIKPTPLAAAAPSWLTRFRKHGRFGARIRA
jgi:uncharacterized protein YbjT (DUF2867 family)